MLVATMLSAMLMAGILAVLAGVARDRKHLNAAETSNNPQAVLDRLQWDLTNAQTLLLPASENWVVLVGHGAIDPGTLSSNGRLCRVTYRVYFSDGASYLVREQQYLDDPLTPSAWRELLAVGIGNFRVIAPPTEVPDVAAMAPSDGGTRIPEQVRVQFTTGSLLIDRQLWVR
jgi:hypothetical protein